MYEVYWGLRTPPFRQGGVENYVSSPVHDEALARLHYLVEANHRLGLLLGAPASGKSLVLDVAAQQWRGVGATVANVNLVARDARETLWSLASGWGLDLDVRMGQFDIWRAISDRLAEGRWQQVPVIALLDDADRASSDVLDLVLRLAHCEPTAASRLTVVLAAQTDRFSELGRRLLGLVELRIDLAAWDLTDTHNYLTHCLAQAGRPQSAFAEDAVMRIHELSEGIVGRIARLAELSLLAAAGSQLSLVDAHTVEAVYGELGVMETAVAV
ncbi:MAG TPA: hypothetical protein PK867_15845 [Pirellulales bacterium]|nr:hypothetical protein [Pirellulales bacterium]